MKQGGMKVNSRGIHLRNIRAIFNYAKKENITSSYPFNNYRIKKEETEKRCLTVEQFRNLRDYPVEPHQILYRDMWLLMFYLIGIEAIDLFSIKKEQFEGGRLLYTRAKTGTLYSIKVEPEAMEIINKYSGKGEYLLCVRDNYKNYKDFLSTSTLSLHLPYIA